MEISSSTSLVVEFHDVDSMNIVWHGHYVKYLEIARCRLLEKIGYDYNVMLNSGFAWPIVDIRVKYIKPIVFQQHIIIETHLVEWEHRLKFNYSIFDKISMDKLSKATTTQMAINMKTNETLFESPDLLINLINKWQNE